MQQNDLLLKKLCDINMYAILCPIKATMACTVKRSTMSVCRPPARTTPPAGISSTPTSVSVHHSLKVRMRCRCVCVCMCFRRRCTSINQLHVHMSLLLCLCACAGRHCEVYKDPCLKMHCQNGGHCESSGLNVSCTCQPGYLGEHWRHHQPE